PAQLSLSLSASHYTGGYREMTEAMDPDSQSYQNSWNASLNWNNDIMGSVSVQYSADSGDENGGGSRYLMASWSKTLGHASLSLNWQHALSSDDSEYNSQNDGDTFYASLIIPFGTERISTYMRSQGDKRNSGVQDSGNIGQSINYNLSA